MSVVFRVWYGCGYLGFRQWSDMVCLQKDYLVFAGIVDNLCFREVPE